MKKSSHIIGAAIGLALAGTGGAMAELTPADYCEIRLTTPASVKESRPMPDGETFSAISNDGRRIEIFSYATGKQTGVLFDLDKVKGSVKLDSFDGYSLSDNEKKILLWTDSNQIYRHSFTAEYYVYDIMRQTIAKVTPGGPQRGGVISHDGRMVAYTRDNDVYVANLEYGTDVRVTTDGEKNRVINGSPDWAYEEEFGVLNTLCWSGDDSVLAFVRFDESKVPTYSFDNYRSYCHEDPLGDPYPEAYSYKYPLAGYPNSIVSVHAWDVETRKTKKMQLPMAESDYVPCLQFDGKGERLMVMTLNRDQNLLQLFSVNTGSTVATRIYQEKSKAWLSPSAYQMVRFLDNSFIIGSDRSGWRHLYQYNYNGTLQRQLTKGEYNVTAYYGYNSRRGLHFVQTTQLGAINRNIAQIDSKGIVSMLHKQEGTESGVFSSNCDYYIRNYSSATVPPQYTLWTVGGKKVKDLELNEAYARKYAEAPVKEFVKVRNADGEEMNAYVIRPRDLKEGESLPLMMYQYNGPESQEVLNRWKITGEYLIASKGYIVASVDGRGTGGRSRQWADAVYRRLGHYETLDQIAGAREIAKRPEVDESRLACFGWSYGGYMTLMELTQPGSPFKAGVSMAPVTDWRFYDSIYTERYMLTPGQNEAGYNAASALDRTGNLQGRLLIMSGTSDDNVHFYNTLKYTSKLNYEGKVFDMMAFTGFEHSLPMCNARERLYAKILDFLNTYVK